MGREVEISFGGPEAFAGQAAFRGLVGLAGLRHSVAAGYAGDAALRAYGEVALFHVVTYGVERLFDVLAVCVGVDEAALAALAPEQVVEGSIEGLGFDIPEGNVDGRDGGHGDGAATPVCSAIEILPDVFDIEGIAADETGKNVLGEIAGDCEFTSVERGVAETVEACVGLDLEGYKVTVG